MLDESVAQDPPSNGIVLEDEVRIALGLTIPHTMEFLKYFDIFKIADGYFFISTDVVDSYNIKTLGDLDRMSGGHVHLKYLERSINGVSCVFVYAGLNGETIEPVLYVKKREDRFRMPVDEPHTPYVAHNMFGSVEPNPPLAIPGNLILGNFDLGKLPLWSLSIKEGRNYEHNRL